MWKKTLLVLGLVAGCVATPSTPEDMMVSALVETADFSGPSEVEDKHDKKRGDPKIVCDTLKDKLISRSAKRSTVEDHMYDWVVLRESLYYVENDPFLSKNWFTRWMDITHKYPRMKNLSEMVTHFPYLAEDAEKLSAKLRHSLDEARQKKYGHQVETNAKSFKNTKDIPSGSDEEKLKAYHEKIRIFTNNYSRLVREIQKDMIPVEKYSKNREMFDRTIFQCSRTKPRDVNGSEESLSTDYFDRKAYLDKDCVKRFKKDCMNLHWPKRTEELSHHPSKSAAVVGTIVVAIGAVVLFLTLAYFVYAYRAKRREEREQLLSDRL